MLIKTITTTTINVQTGETKSVTTWRVEGETEGLGHPLQVAFARLAESLATTTPAEAVAAAAAEPPPPPARKGAGDPVNRARHLASYLQLSDTDLQDALNTRPIGRVIEVLEWIKGRRTTQPVKSVSALFWSVVSKD